MGHEQHESVIEAPPFPIGIDASLSAYAIIKSCISDRDVVTKIRGEIELNDPMFMTIANGFRDTRSDLHLDDTERGFYMTGCLYGYFSTIFQYQNQASEKNQPVLDSTDIDRYFTTLIKPDNPDMTTAEYVLFNKLLSDEEKPFAFGYFVWLVNTGDQRPFVQDLVQDFVENSKARLSRFKRTETTLVNTGQKRIFGDLELLGENEGFNMGMMDAVLPFYYKYQDESMNKLLSGISMFES